jgi:hypothetical protein
VGLESKKAPYGALYLLPLHRAEELIVGLSVPEFVLQELNSGKVLHTMEKLS